MPSRKKRVMNRTPIPKPKGKKKYALADGRYAMHDLAHAEHSLDKVRGRPEEVRVERAILKAWPSLRPKKETKS